MFCERDDKEEGRKGRMQSVFSGVTALLILVFVFDRLVILKVKKARLASCETRGGEKKRRGEQQRFSASFYLRAIGGRRSTSGSVLNAR